MRRPPSLLFLVLHCAGSFQSRGAERLKKSIKTCFVVESEINVLQAAQSKLNLTLAMYDRDNSFAIFQRKGDLVHHVGGFHCSGRKNHDQFETLCQSVLDGTVPALTGCDVELVYPHAGTRRTQVFGKAQYELGICTSVAQERKLNWFW